MISCNILSNVCILAIPTCRFRCSQEFIDPGFNRHLKELHGKARECYLVWKDVDRPRTGDAHNNMRVSRLRFKSVLCHCRANEEMMRPDALAHSLSSSDSTSFWKDVSMVTNSSKVSLASKVDNAVGSYEITDMWQIHFSDLLNSVHNTVSKGSVSNHIDAVDSFAISVISVITQLF